MRNNVGSVVVCDWAPPRSLDQRAWGGLESPSSQCCSRGAGAQNEGDGGGWATGWFL